MDAETGERDEGAADASGAGEIPVIDLSQVRVEIAALQVASEMMAIGAGHLGLVPDMVNGGDPVQAGLAISAADALIAIVLSAMPEGAELPPELQELRRSVAELKLAYASAIEGAVGGTEAGPAAAEPAPAPADERIVRPSIWTPGGEV